MLRFQNMQKSLNYLKDNGGVLILSRYQKYIQREQAKEYGIGAQIVTGLGIQNINYLTFKPLEYREF